MFKQAIAGIVVAFLLCSNIALAEEAKEGPEVTASVKAWFNEWKHIDPATGRRVSDDAVFLAGPAVEVEFRNHLVLEGSYLMTLSDYKFTEAGITTEFRRRDLDLGLGKRFNQYAAFFVGYRNSSFKENAAGAKDFSYGLFYSLRGELPLRGKSNLYGNVTWLDTRSKAEGQAREEAPGWITEIGGKIAFSEHMAMKLGYKWESEKGKTSAVEDSFRGTTFELSYMF